MDCLSSRNACIPSRGGVQLAGKNAAQALRNRTELDTLLQALGLQGHTCTESLVTVSGHVLVCTLTREAAQSWAPAHDTLGLQLRVQETWAGLDEPQALEREILIALLASPIGFGYPGVEALLSQVRVRRNIALAARKTALAFKTEAAERPEAYWRYDEGNGFLLHPGRPLIEALVCATQPEATGKLYDFSCYRATEYVILLGIAQEAARHHPRLLDELQSCNEQNAIRSGQFHDVFLVEYGSMEAPLPARYYVPGDRLWFRNPDERSSDVMGYEGSWVIYMGGGLFSNFWRRDRPFTLESKCLEVYHWRDGVVTDAAGELQMDEARVEACVQRTQAQPQALRQVLQRMMRMRDAKGVYADGGCIDSTREYPRGVAAGACELVLPPLPGALEASQPRAVPPVAAVAGACP
ncbi:hypothetical protein [Variovorax terrae]|uniref:Uncharacterized protein n=1 Tax=Variovorax terrae TaxID=2923278 RepID=A0A9X1VWN5_9BURK|nr:hypothetical protein [Variovorax terrae]MCJ0764802.1 hypothetical protein [Variovorax terrae]